METKNIMIVGVGGQGSLLASKLLGHLLMEQGYDVKVSEVHGHVPAGRQRGHLCALRRPGEFSVIDKGEADFIVSFELLEAPLAGVLKARRTDRHLHPADRPHARHHRRGPVPREPGGEDEGQGAKVDALDCLALAEEAGSSKAVNIVLMGRLSHYFDLPEEAWQASLEAMVPAKFLELNKKAFQLGKLS